MISRDGDLIVFECNGSKCNEYLDTATYDFTNALDRLRQAKWVSVGRGAIWEHFCPSCNEERAEEKKKQMVELAKKFGDL